MSNSGATCYCHNCRRDIHYLGIARHRAMHRDRREDVTITMSTGTYRWTYSDPEVAAASAPVGWGS